MVSPGTWSSPATNVFPERPGNPASRSPSPVQPGLQPAPEVPVGLAHPNPQLGDGSSWRAGHTCNAYTDTAVTRTKNFGVGYS